MANLARFYRPALVVGRHRLHAARGMAGEALLLAGDRVRDRHAEAAAFGRGRWRRAGGRCHRHEDRQLIRRPGRGRDRRGFHRHDPEHDEEHHQRGNDRERYEDAFATAHAFRAGGGTHLAGSQPFQLLAVLLLHLVGRHLAREHGLVEALEVHVIEVPDQDREHRQDGLAAVSRLGSRDKLAGQDLRRGDGIPEDETGEAHDCRAPKHGPILSLLGEVVARQLGMCFGQPQVITQYIEGIEDILWAGEHAQLGAAHIGLVGQDDDMVDGFQGQNGRRDAMDDADILDAAQQLDESRSDFVAGKLLRQPGEPQGRKRDDQHDVLDALEHRESLRDLHGRRRCIGLVRHGVRSLGPAHDDRSFRLNRLIIRRTASIPTNSAMPPITAGMRIL